jgi:nucleoside-diphosphate-sugar epimerase
LDSTLKGKKVLVTGGAGFIGSHLVDALVRLDADVRVVDNLSRGKIGNLASCKDRIEFIQGDLKEPRTADSAVVDVDLCFHLAASVGSVEFMNTNPAEIFCNASIDYNVLEACRKGSVDRMLYTSSACVYSTDLQTSDDLPPLKESDLLTNGAKPDGDYGWTKYFGEIESRAFNKAYGMKIAIVRPFNPYGPRESFDPKDSHVIPSLIRKSANRENPFVVWGDGKQERAFEYVADLVESFILAIQKSADAEPINVGSSTPIAIRTIAEKILEIMNSKLAIVWDTTKPQGVRSRKANMSKAQNLLGWSPKTSLDEGLRKTIDWYLEQRRNSL